MRTIRKLLIGRSALPGGGGCAASASPAGGVSGVAPSSRCRNVFPLESIRAAAVHPGQVGQFTIGDTAVPSANRVVEDAPRILAQNSLLEMLGEILRSLVSDVFRANLPGAAIPPQAPQDGPLCGVRAGLTEVLPGLGERDLDVGDRSVRAGEFESAANVAFDIAPASRSHATPKTVSPQFSALDPSPDGLGADFQPVRDGRDRRQCQSKSS